MIKDSCEIYPQSILLTIQRIDIHLLYMYNPMSMNFPCVLSVVEAQESCLDVQSF